MSRQYRTFFIEHPVGTVSIPVVPGVVASEVIEASLKTLCIGGNVDDYCLFNLCSGQTIQPEESMDAFDEDTSFILTRRWFDG